VINGSPKVSESTRARVLAALEEHTPNANARAMRLGRTGAVGVVVSGITNPYVPEMLEALSGAAPGSGVTLTLWNEQGSDLANAVAGVRGGTVDGLILTSATTSNVAALQRLIDRGTPMVLMNRGLSFLDVDQVTSDNEQIGRLVARYVIKQGRKRIGLVVGPSDIEAVVERREGLLDELWVNGGLDVPRAAIVQGELTFGTGEAAAKALLDAGVDTICCGNDVQAMGAIAGVQAAGARVPEDVWVVGIDDLEMSTWRPFDLTTVRQQIHRMAESALSLLLARLEDPSAPVQKIRVPGELVVRGSTGRSV